MKNISHVSKPVHKPATSSVKKAATTPTKIGSQTQASSKKLDTSGVSKEARESGAASSRVNGLLSGMQDWAGGTKGASEVKPMSLDKGELLRKGMTGDKVKQLQDMLNSKGAQLKVDGKFGPNTLKALKSFQKDNKLGVDGVVGPNTLEKLNGKTDGVANTDKTGQAGKVDGPAKDKPGVDQGKQATDSSAAGDKRFANTRQALDKLPGPLKKYADTFQKMGEKYGVDPRFLASISMHETGKGTSSAFRNKNNAMGISNRRGPIRMGSVEQSIERMAKTLSKPNGYYKGKSTIGQIGKVYAPVGASNDPNGLNGYWAKGVAKNFKMFGGDPTQQVIFR